ncbi:hypothetical protein AVEN_164228-1 [Araneus ventricosus]|uniref:Integrase p58-like C-terminal domain-containing protein n=1 Tax=Araneus ventricosus TaxID=182803 RepID=A0A4Y2NNA3_ARAVE|nr:hypothetical protein AVEN_164228-1 [Araneus ventricosus]
MRLPESELMKTRYDFKATDHHFKEHDLVCMHNPKRRRGLTHSLCTPNQPAKIDLRLYMARRGTDMSQLQENGEGPYTIIKKQNDVVYRVQKSSNAKSKVIHINRLVP